MLREEKGRKKSIEMRKFKVILDGGKDPFQSVISLFMSRELAFSYKSMKFTEIGRCVCCIALRLVALGYNSDSMGGWGEMVFMAAVTPE